LVVTANLIEVSSLELQGDVHEHLGDVGGRLVADGIFWQFERARSRHADLLFDLVFHAEAFALDDHGIDVVRDAIENGGGQRAIIVEDLCPVLVGAI
jgi:hypothetical protein